MSQNQNWTEVIESKHSLFKLNLKEVWQYRDLVYMFVKRDFISFYKQTILGPLWFVLQPLMSTALFYFVFVVMAKTQEKGILAFVFILSGQIMWSYFSTSLNKVASVFNNNKHIMGKVYFPRLVMPFSIVISGLLKFFVQVILFLIAYFYAIYSGEDIQPTYWVLAFPYLILLMALISLGLGMIFSSLTIKYKDLAFLLTFGISMLMYVTPVVFPYSTFGEYQYLININPLVGIFECFREGFLGHSDFKIEMLIYSSVFAIIIFFIGAVIYNKVEKSFMDTV